MGSLVQVFKMPFRRTLHGGAFWPVFEIFVVVRLLGFLCNLCPKRSSNDSHQHVNQVAALSHVTTNQDRRLPGRQIQNVV
jgi:hypothetical protein